MLFNVYGSSALLNFKDREIAPSGSPRTIAFLKREKSESEKQGVVIILIHVMRNMLAFLGQNIKGHMKSFIAQKGYIHFGAF